MVKSIWQYKRYTPVIWRKFFQKSWVRFAVHKFLELPKKKKYIFIVGNYNSGTSLLDNLLSSHEEISNLPTEGVSLTEELRSPEELGWPRMWHMCQEQLEVCKLAEKPNINRLKKDWGLWFDSSKELWLEKSIVNAINIDWLEQNFDQPYFIWIVRNGYAVTEGIQRRTKNRNLPPQFEKGYPIELCARQWEVSNAVIEKKLRNVKRKIKITYESLSEDPQQTIQNILDWLPVNNKSYVLPSEFTFHNQREKVRNKNQESIDRLSVEQVSTITQCIGQALEHHGYNILETRQ